MKNRWANGSFSRGCLVVLVAGLPITGEAEGEGAGPAPSLLPPACGQGGLGGRSFGASLAQMAKRFFSRKARGFGLLSPNHFQGDFPGDRAVSGSEGSEGCGGGGAADAPAGSCRSRVGTRARAGPTCLPPPPTPAWKRDSGPFGSFFQEMENLNLLRSLCCWARPTVCVCGGGCLNLHSGYPQVCVGGNSAFLFAPDLTPRLRENP